jgi:ATP-dependent exoDNAse (exonuclease V) beta subunit
LQVLQSSRILRRSGAVVSTTFNAGQRLAVESRAARIVVSAGAGSGKTRVLVQRFVDRVLEQEAAGDPAPIRAVLLITFTDKAAGELAERVRVAFLDRGRPDLAREVDGAWISTIHGFCARMVRRHALELGVDAGFSVLADPEVGVARTAAFERAALRCVGSGDHRVAIAGLLEEGVEELRTTVVAAYDRARSKGVGVEDVEVAPPAGFQPEITGLEVTLDDVLPRYRLLRETATVVSNLAGFSHLREELVLVRALGDTGEGAEAAFALSRHAGACRGDEETKSLTRRINGALQEVARAAIDRMAAEQAQAWRTLLLAFSDEYEACKAEQGVLDFEDLQLLTRRLWNERPDVAQHVGSRFVEVMVDEFQDTNPLQIETIAPISQGGQCLVGDVQQSIYRFRDADVALLEERVRSADASDSEQACRLSVNYRSDATLLEGLNRVFGADTFFGDGYLTLESGVERALSTRGPDDPPRIQALLVDKSRCVDEDWRAVEARALAQRLRSVVERGEAAPGEIVVLVRASTTMAVYVSALRDAGFNVVASSSRGFYETPEYADVRALLRVLADPADDEGVLAVLAGGFGGLSDDALLALSRHEKARGLWRALGDHGAAAGLSPDDETRALLVHSTIERLREFQGRLPLADAVLHAAWVLGRGGGLLERVDAWANVTKAIRIIAGFEKAGAGDPERLLRYLDDRETFVPREPAAGLSEDAAGAVRVMTVHAAKGLEFPVVVVADLGHGSVNSHPRFLLATEGERLVAVARGPKAVGCVRPGPSTTWATATERERLLDVAEAKRVFYVACTRAQRALILTGATQPGGASHDDIAAEWLLDAVRRDGTALSGLLTVSVMGPADAPAGPAREREASLATMAAADVALEPLLPEPGAIPPPAEISYTALALFERCAYRFFAERMLRVGSVKAPGPEDPLAFGSALHAALESLARGQVLDDDRTARIAAARGLSEGSLTRLGEAVRAVRESEVGPLLAVGRPEVPFAIRAAGGVVRGTMDLLIRDGALATVIDYKTGRTWDATGARYGSQAEVDALAMLVSGTAEVRVRFVHVEAGCEEAEYRFDAADAPRVLDRVGRSFERMRTGDFPPLSAYDPVLCADCPVSGGLCRIVHPHVGRCRV